jgi:hypothetical protein
MASCRKPKYGEIGEVAELAPPLRAAALELPRSFRKRALARCKSLAIDVTAPNEQHTEEALTIFANLQVSYAKKAANIKDAAERKRFESWAIKNDPLAKYRPNRPRGVPVGCEIPVVHDDPVEQAVMEVMISVNRKLQLEEDED